MGVNDSLKNGVSRGAWLNFNTQAEYFDPYEGIIDLASSTGKRNIRYGYSLSGQNLLTGERMVSEVISNPLVYPIPNVPKWIKGLINLRGNLVPVFDLAGQFKDAGEKAEGKPLFVLDRGERAVGIFIDKLPIGIEIDDELAESIPVPESADSMLKEYIQKAFKVGDEIWYEIEYNAFFSNLTMNIHDSAKVVI